MAGFRIGYAVLPDGVELPLAPVSGVSAPALAGALWAIEHGAEAVRRRRAHAAAERGRLEAALDDTPFHPLPPATDRMSGLAPPQRGATWPRRWPRGGSTSRPAPPGATSTTSRERRRLATDGWAAHATRLVGRGRPVRGDSTAVSLSACRRCPRRSSSASSTAIAGTPGAAIA